MSVDGTLVQRALRGDRAARDELVCRWSARVLAFCHARVRNRQTAEDLAQESLLRGMRGLDKLEDGDKFGPWLFGIAMRVWHDWRKAKQASQVPFTTLAADHHDSLARTEAGATVNDVDRRDELVRLMDEVHALPDKYREIVMLYYYQDVTYEELAHMLGVSFATVNARLTQARSMLRERLSGARR